MASGKEENYASLYSAVSSAAFETGSSFLETLDVKPGYKVVDMGCGTGELAVTIAEKVGEHGEVVGVDPDEARIKVAQDKLKIVSNASFHVGNSEGGFPNDNQPYYDLYFSNQVYHWLSNEQKAIYVKVALQCLKPGGSIGIQCMARSEQEINNRFNEQSGIIFPDENSTIELFRKCGFRDVDVKVFRKPIYFNSFDEFAVCYLAIMYKNIDEFVDKALLEEFKKKSMQEDGSAKIETCLIQIKARK